MELNEKLYNLRKLRGLTLEQVGERVGVGKSTVRKWESGQIANMRRDKIAKLAHALSVSPAYLMGWTEDPSVISVETRRVPIIGDTAAGAPITAERVYDEYVELPADGKRYDAAVHITGDSMEPTYRLGDLALLRYQPDVEDGEAAVVCIDDTVTLKRVYHLSGKVMLQSDNPKYQPILVDEGSCNNVHLVGKVIGFVHWEE